LDSPENAEMRQEIYAKVRDIFGIGDGSTTEVAPETEESVDEPDTLDLGNNDDLTDEPIV